MSRCGDREGALPDNVQDSEHDAPASDGPRGPAFVTPGMRAVLISVGVIVVVSLALVVWASSLGGAAPQTPTGAPAPTGSTAPGQGATASTSAPSTVASPSPSASDTAQPPTSEPPGPQPSAAPTSGSEVTTPDATEAPSDRIPPRPTPTPLIRLPLPAPGSASGTLVAGFPTFAMGPPPGADVVDNSIATDGATMQVTLVGRTDAAPADVVQYYRDTWARLSLIDQSPAGSPTDAAYSDSFTTLSLAFPPATGTGTMFMVFGVFRAS